MGFDGRILNGIGVLAAVVESKTFGRAATTLGLTPSGVSRAIARLEEHVGVRLLHRSARAVTLTDEGRRFYDAVAPLMAGIEAAASDVAGAKTKPRGLLRVACDPLVARTILAPRIASFLSDYPELAVDLLVHADLRDLATDGFDVAIRFGDVAPSALIARKLLETRVVTCASPSYLARAGRPSHPRELSQHTSILFRDPETNRPFEWIFQRGKKTLTVKARGRLIVNDSATALAACIAGHGVAQPLELELRGLGDHGLIDLFPDWADERFPLHVYYPSRRHVPAKVRALIDFVVASSHR